MQDIPYDELIKVKSYDKIRDSLNAILTYLGNTQYNIYIPVSNEINKAIQEYNQKQEQSRKEYEKQRLKQIEEQQKQQRIIEIKGSPELKEKKNEMHSMYIDIRQELQAEINRIVKRTALLKRSYDNIETIKTNIDQYNPEIATQYKNIIDSGQYNGGLDTYDKLKAPLDDDLKIL